MLVQQFECSMLRPFGRRCTANDNEIDVVITLMQRLMNQVKDT
jgi:hypothetical protein